MNTNREEELEKLFAAYVDRLNDGEKLDADTLLAENPLLGDELLGYLFLGTGGVSCLDAADVNDDGKNDVSDPVTLLGHLFLGDPAPTPPFGDCGSDPTDDKIDCGGQVSCK